MTIDPSSARLVADYVSESCAGTDRGLGRQLIIVAVRDRYGWGLSEALAAIAAAVAGGWIIRDPDSHGAAYRPADRNGRPSAGPIPLGSR